MPRDICDCLADREQVALLRRHGFSRLLEAIESDPGDVLFATSGRVCIDKLADKLGTTNASCSAMLHDARRLLEGERDMADGKYYLDPVAFTDLLRNNSGNRNRRRIFLGLNLIAVNLAKSKEFRFAGQLREDAVSHAVLHAAGKIHRFDRRRRDAFWFFSKIIRLAMLRFIAREQKIARDLPPLSVEGRVKKRSDHSSEIVLELPAIRIH